MLGYSSNHFADKISPVESKNCFSCYELERKKLEAGMVDTLLLPPSDLYASITPFEDL